MIQQAKATIDDLMREPGKAELIGGRIVRYMGTGYWPNYVAGEIFSSLREYAKRTKKGRAFSDNLVFVVPELSTGRQSFSPDTGYYNGPLPKKRMSFIKGAPTLAVEVRSENDSSREIAEKRAEYFEAGTLVVWDVDPEAECVHVYRADAPDKPVTYRRGQRAEAEPAVPEWKVAVDSIFTE